MKHAFTILLLALLCGLTATAVPARPGKFTVTQKDGTVITLTLVGDEYSHYYVNDATGQPMAYDAAAGEYVVLSSTALGQRSQRANVRRTAANAKRAGRLPQNRHLSPLGPNRAVGQFGNMTGSKKGLVLIVNFKDRAIYDSDNSDTDWLDGIDVHHTRQTFDDMFNKQGYNLDGHIGSVHDYFYDQSYGQFDLSFDVVGPVTVENNMSYYGGNDYSGNDKHAAAMVIEACKLADQQGVDFSRYDWDGDGEVDQVFVIYAGYGENYAGADESCIWPHEWDLDTARSYGDGTGSFKLDGVTINTYACASELQGFYVGGEAPRLNPIGTACHEFSHCLGFPDFYDTDYSGAFGMSAWDVMDMGSYNGPSGYGEVPSGYTAYERWMAGWITPTELSGGMTISGMKALGDDPEAYVLYNAGNRNEYILFENRQPNRWFSYIEDNRAGSGLLAVHVDYNAQSWADNGPNDDPNRQRMTIIPAGKSYGTYSRTDKAWTTSSSVYRTQTFPGTSRITSLTPTSHTAYGGKWVSTSATNLGHSLTEIAEQAGLVSFLFDGGGVVDDGSRYTVSLNAGTGSCSTTTWTQSGFGESLKLPTAYLPSGYSGWTFIGWSTEPAQGSKPATMLSANSYYAPTADVTLYAVYKQAATSGSSDGGSYTLDYTTDAANIDKATQGYGKARTYTAPDGGVWTIKAHPNSGLQINKGKNASIKVPACPSPITTIEVTDNSAKALSFSAQDYTGSNSPSDPVTSASSTTAVLDLTGKNLTTGYIYTTDGATVISKIVVNYGEAGGAATYKTWISTAEEVTPTVSFAEPNISLSIGDYRVVTPTVTGVDSPTITYTSSDPSVATVGPKTGGVKAQGEGQCTITATVAAVSGVSREARASYTVSVAAPAISGIVITTPPSRLSYIVGEEFDPAGMAVSIVYANGYKEPVPDGYFSWTPSGALTPDVQAITVSYYENGVYYTTTQPITVRQPMLYTVTFLAGGGTISAAGDPTTLTLSETAEGSGIVLPAASTTADGWAFCGWTTSAVTDATPTVPSLHEAGTTYRPTADATLYAVYVRRETSAEGSGDYAYVGRQLDDWSGTYLLGRPNKDGLLVVANGQKGGKNTGGFGGENTCVIVPDACYDFGADVIDGTWGDAYSFTLEATEGGYLLRTQDNLYNYQNAFNSGVLTTDERSVAAEYPIVISFSDDVVKLRIDVPGSSSVFLRYNDVNDGQEFFRFYKTTAENLKEICLYRKDGGPTTCLYSSYPAASAPVTIGTIVGIIARLGEGIGTLDDLRRAVDALLTSSSPFEGGEQGRGAGRK